jgi:hypothetical protein
MTKKPTDFDFTQELYNCDFAIWIDSTCLQNFLAERCMAMNVPMLVWEDCSSPGSSVPHWNESCGETFQKFEDFDVALFKFMTKIENYQPRNYILQTLTANVCMQRILDCKDKHTK